MATKKAKTPSPVDQIAARVKVIGQDVARLRQAVDGTVTGQVTLLLDLQRRVEALEQAGRKGR